MKKKPLELQRCFVAHLGGLNMISSDGASILAAWTEYRFKKYRFPLLVKTTGVCSKALDKHYIYEDCKIFFFFFEIHDFWDYFCTFFLKQEL